SRRTVSRKTARDASADVLPVARQGNRSPGARDRLGPGLAAGARLLQRRDRRRQMISTAATKSSERRSCWLGPAELNLGVRQGAAGCSTCGNFWNACSSTYDGAKTTTPLRMACARRRRHERVLRTGSPAPGVNSDPPGEPLLIDAPASVFGSYDDTTPGNAEHRLISTPHWPREPPQLADRGCHLLAGEISFS